MSDKRRSDVPHRPKISYNTLRRVEDEIDQKLNERMVEKGNGAWLSRHEILGIMEEEYTETVDAVHGGTLEELKEELKDIAVGAIFAIACIEQGTLDW